MQWVFSMYSGRSKVLIHPLWKCLLISPAVRALFWKSLWITLLIFMWAVKIRCVFSLYLFPVFFSSVMVWSSFNDQYLIFFCSGSNSRAITIAGLTTLACLLLASQVFTAYMVLDHKQQIHSLQKNSERMSKQMIRIPQGRKWLCEISYNQTEWGVNSWKGKWELYLEKRFYLFIYF